MAVFSGAFSVPGTSASITLQLHVSQASQNIANNTSTLNWTLQAVKGSAGYPFTNNARSSAYAYVNGTVLNVGGLSYNFPSGAYTWVISSGSTVVSHNADGTKAVWCEASFSDAEANIGNASCSGSMGLTTIPRATQPTVSPSTADTASAITIGHTPATSSFYHDISYSINGGSSFTSIQANIVGTDTSTSWTPPHTLLPNDAEKVAIVRCVTRASSGGTVIGTKDVDVTLKVPHTVKPAVSAVTWAEAQLASPNMATLMGGAGRYVRRWSKLKPTVTSTGAGGASVVSSSVTMAGQTTPSGTAFANPIDSSGNVSFAATAVDTRGRSSDPYYNTVTVKAYDYPNLPVPTITRTSDAAGLVPSPTGTYLRITPNASTSKLDFSGEKNLLEWQIRTRPKGGGTWTTAQAWTAATVSGNTIWTTPKIIAGYSASAEFEVEVSIRDVFGKNGFDTASTVKSHTMNVPSEAVFMDWDEANGIGLGRYHAAGGARLQVADGIDVSSGGLSVAGTSILTSTTTLKGIVELATNAETQAGSDAVRVVTPAALKSVTATESRAGLVERATKSEAVLGLDDTRYITPKAVRDILGREGIDVPITLDRSKSYMTYGERHTSTGFEGRVKATVLSSGAVVLSGLLFIEGAPTSGGIIGSLPVEYAPEYVVVAPVEYGDNPRTIQIHPDGTLRVGSGALTNQYLSIDGVGYIRSGYGTWVAPTSFGSQFVQHDTASFGSVAMYKDPYGMVWWRGAIKVVTSGFGDNTIIANLPSGYSFPTMPGGITTEGHYRVSGNGALGIVSVSSASTLKWKSNTPNTVNAIIQLGGLVSITQEALDGNDVKNVIWAAHSWKNYSQTHYPHFKIIKRADGLRLLSGLLNAGSIGQHAYALSSEDAPQMGSKIMSTVSDTGRARLDLCGRHTDVSERCSKVYIQQGSNGWYSLDGVYWVP